jgi:Myb-like DNA-binding domain
MFIFFSFIGTFRWHNHLNPEIRKDAWTAEEESQLINAHRLHGNKWAEIAKLMPGRFALSYYRSVKFWFCEKILLYMLANWKMQRPQVTEKDYYNIQLQIENLCAAIRK